MHDHHGDASQLMSQKTVNRILYLVAITLFSLGVLDLDWMIVAPRFNPWYYTVEYWEFCPYIKMNWWLAYAYTLARIVLGAGLIGYLIRGEKTD